MAFHQSAASSRHRVAARFKRSIASGNRSENVDGRSRASPGSIWSGVNEGARANARRGFAAAAGGERGEGMRTNAIADDDEGDEIDGIDFDDDEEDLSANGAVKASTGVSVDAAVDELLSSVKSTTTWGGDWPEFVILLARLQALGYSGAKLEGEEDDSERTTKPPEWARAVAEPPKNASTSSGDSQNNEEDLTPTDAGEVKRLVLAFCRDRPDLFAKLPERLVYQLIDWPLPRKMNNRKLNAGMQRLRSGFDMDIGHLRGKCSATDKLSDRPMNPILQLSDFMRVILALSEIQDPAEFPGTEFPSKDLASDALRRLLRLADSEKPAPENMPKDTSIAPPRSERSDREFRPRWDEDRGGSFGGRGGGRFDADRRGGRGGRFGDRDRDFDDRPPRRSFDRDDRPRFERRDDFGGRGGGRSRDFGDREGGGFERRPRFDRDRDEFAGGRGRDRDDFSGGGRGRPSFGERDGENREGGGFERRPRFDRERDDFGGGRGRGSFGVREDEDREGGGRGRARFDRDERDDRPRFERRDDFGSRGGRFGDRERDDFGGGRGRGGGFDREDRPPRRSFDRDYSERPMFDSESRESAGRGRGRGRFGDREGGGFERRERDTSFGGGRGRGRDFADRDRESSGFERRDRESSGFERRDRPRFDRGDRDDFGGGRGRGRFDRGDRDDFGRGRGRGGFDRDDRPPRRSFDRDDSRGDGFSSGRGRGRGRGDRDGGGFGDRFAGRGRGDGDEVSDWSPKPSAGADEVRVWRDE